MENVPIRGFGVVNYLHRIFLFVSSSGAKHKTFRVLTSHDGIQFFFYDDTGNILRTGESFEDIERTDDFRISKQQDEYFGTYTLTSDRKTLNLALSHDGVHFQKIGRINGVESVGMLVPEYKWNNKYILYYGNHALKVGFSENLVAWDFQKDTHLTPVKHRKLTVSTIVVRDEGIYVFYFALKRHDKEQKYTLNVLLFDKNDPGRQLWEKEKVIWRQKDEFVENVYPMGMSFFENTPLSYWRTEKGSIVTVIHHFSFEKKLGTQPQELLINKHPYNPILTPVNHNLWESEAAFNAAAIYDEGRVHLIYRAVGSAGISMLGYATSRDGLTIDTRSRHPIYFPRMPFEGAAQTSCAYPNTYASGPGSGGCEDPRITKIDGRYFLTYVAFNGWFPRLAMTSISEEDFKNQNWQKWREPVVISQPNVVDKSGAILPEKIDGKYVVFHRVFPHILIDFVDSLDDFDGKKTFLKGEYKIGPRKYHWDSRKIGVGATPIKTDDGWLVIYNAVDDRDDSRYKIGAMLLDLKDPTQVIARSENPILEPTEQYENGGLKYGIVYPCGAVNLNDQLIVYYGGSDQVLCAATAPFTPFVNELKRHGKPQISAAYARHVHPIIPS